MVRGDLEIQVSERNKRQTLPQPSWALATEGKKKKEALDPSYHSYNIYIHFRDKFSFENLCRCVGSSGQFSSGFLNRWLNGIKDEKNGWIMTASRLTVVRSVFHKQNLIIFHLAVVFAFRFLYVFSTFFFLFNLLNWNFFITRCLRSFSSFSVNNFIVFKYISRRYIQENGINRASDTEELWNLSTLFWFN